MEEAYNNLVYVTSIIIVICLGVFGYGFYLFRELRKIKSEVSREG